MGRGWMVAVVLLGGCGRLAFDGVVPGDAPGGDGPGGDAPGDVTDGPPSFVCLPSYRLCDGFETQGFQTFWTVLGNVTVDNTIAHRGTQSVKFHAPATIPALDTFVQLSETTSLPFADPTLYVRAWVRLGVVPVNNMGLISTQQSGSTPQEVAMFVLPDSLGVYSQFVDSSRHNNTVPPTNTWFCAIWRIVRATNGTGALYLTGDQPPAQLTAVTTDGTPPLRELAVGIQLSGSTNTFPQAAFDVWVDDLIVSPNPVTCAD